jgi:hypothetical protein
MIKTCCATITPSAKRWLADQGSNLDKQDQNLLCYHYTISQ